MVKAVFLVSSAKGMIDVWEGQTSKKRRALLSDKDCLNCKANGFKVFPAKVYALERKAKEKIEEEISSFSFISSVERPEEVLKLIKKNNFSPKKDETVIILSKQDPETIKMFLGEKTAGRYHYKDGFGWIIALKEIGIHEVSEFTGIFFKNEKLEKNQALYAAKYN